MEQCSVAMVYLKRPSICHLYPSEGETPKLFGLQKDSTARSVAWKFNNL